MNILPELIGLLNKEEARGFKLFANRTNADTNRKDLLLFDTIKKKLPAYDEEDIFSQIYKGKDKNSFYRLKNRLIDDIGMSLSILHFHASEIHTILNNYLLARIFIARSNWSLAGYYIAKAEKKARGIEAFHILDMLYNEFIKLSHEVLGINPEEYIRKRKENLVSLKRLQEIDDVLAVVIYQVRTGQNFSRGNERINELLSKVVSSYAGTKEVRNSPLLRFRIYDSVSRILLQQHNFKALENYLLKTYREFTAEKLFNRSNHDTKLQMLTYISNALFKNKKTSISLEYAFKLDSAMNEFSGMLRNKYLFFYYNILVNNYASQHIEKAIDILNEAKEQKAIKEHPVYIGFVYLNLAVSYFGVRDFRTSLKSIVKLYMLDGFKTLDEAFRFKISVTELIVRYELGDMDYIEERVKQLRKEFKVVLLKKDYERERGLMEIILKLAGTASPKNDKKIQEAVARFTKESQGKDEEPEIINYNEWLREKLKK